FVEEGGGINGDLAAHDPGGMFEGALDGDPGEILPGGGSERPAGGGEPKAAHRGGRFAIQTLKDGGVLAVHGQDPASMLARFGHNDLAGHDEDFLGGDG